MARVFIGIGSNIRPQENVLRALGLLAEKARIMAVSTIYLTEPECPECHVDLPEYLNGVVAIETDLPPVELKYSVLREIENELGRTRTDDKYAPRTIDLDILLYDDLVINENGLDIPDPGIAERPFIAIPLAEIAPDLVLPDSGLSITEVAARHAENTMHPLREFTDKIRREFHNGSQES
jgi:2-amino-4-hydroxy-6-hydroxymethyldihydropteridine diphosphokinase